MKRDPVSGKILSQGGARAARVSDLPSAALCLMCGETKPRAQMIVVHERKQGQYRLRPRCKDCHNERERGHRREWKRRYLKKWRARNAALTKSYWDNAEEREKARVNSYRRFVENHEALLIQGRLRRRGFPTSIAEAKDLLQRFGRCYPSRYGLTEEGLREAERIRKQRRRKLKLSAVEIRIMLYEDGLFIPPDRQPVPYQTAGRRLREWQAQRAAQRKAA